MNILGISAGFHDAAATVIDQQGNILFAGHSERYSKIKNDPNIHPGLIADALQHGSIGTIAYYERPWVKQTRQFYSGQGIELNKLTVNQILKAQLKGQVPGPYTVRSYNHHLSHAAAGFQTSPYDRATVVVIDAIGEWDTISIWGAEYINGQAKYIKLWGQKYPHSIGLFYSAMTQRAGLKPNEEEYILMGMAAYGERGFGDLMKMNLLDNEWEARFKENLHAGLGAKYLSYVGDMDIAAGAQDLCEDLIYNIIRRAKDFNYSKNLV